MSNFLKESFSRMPQEELIQIVFNDEDYHVRKIAIGYITDQEILRTIALNDEEEYRELKRVAMSKVTDEMLLKNIALNHKDWFIRSEALELLTEKSYIREVILKETSYSITVLPTIRKLTDIELLQEIAVNADSKYIRKYAKKRLKELKTKKEQTYLRL